MRLAFVKQPWCVAWSWQSTRFETPRQMLDSFYYKSGCFSLLAHWRGDVWVMEESECRSGDRAMWEGGDPEAARLMWARTPLTPWADVPWGEYDVVISAGRIVPVEVIQAHPHVLWCVMEGEHTAFGDKEPGEYDLFWNYSDADVMPYMVNPDVMRELVQPTNEAGVWLPSRMVRVHVPGMQYMGKWPQPDVELDGLLYKQPDGWNLGCTYRAALNGDIEPPLDFWRRQGACRYLFNLRQGGQVGQPIVEAAALGLVVVSRPEAYDVVCHPRCRVETSDEALEVIGELERYPVYWKMALIHQYGVLYEKFWRKPLAKLEEAVGRKRRA